MIRMFRGVVVSAAIGFASAQAVAQSFVEGATLDNTARVETLGVGAVALDNTSGRSVITNPSSGLDGKVQVGADAHYAPGQFEVKNGGFTQKVDTGESSARAYGLIPVGKLSGANTHSGIGVAAASTVFTYENPKDASKKSERAEDRLSLLGVLAVKNWTFGLRLKHVSRDTSNRYGTAEVESRYEGKDTSSSSYNNAALGVGVEPVRGMLKLALAYNPKNVYWYKVKSSLKETTLATGVASTRDSTYDEVGGDAESFVLGAALKVPGSPVRMLAGVARELPYNESLKEGSNTTSTHQAGHTTASLALEINAPRGVTPRVGIHNASLEDNAYWREVAGGADFAVSSAVVLNAGAGYRKMHSDVDGTEVEWSSWRATLGLGANL